jgi:NADH-quinone oxidoreductase subunit H
MESLGYDILGAVITIILAFVVGLTYMGLSRKITARVQNRKGPPVYQNFIDALKLASKSSAIHHGFMQHVGRAIMMGTSIGSVLVIPVLTTDQWFSNLNFRGDLIFILYIMFFGPLGMALGAGQTGNPNSAIGVTRGLSQMAGFEVPWVMALVALMMQHHTTSLVDLMNIQQASGTWMMFSSPFAFIAAVLAMFGMFRYSPFDIVGAPTELASGPVSENGGKYLFTLMSSNSIFAFAKLTLYVNLFLGGADNLIILLLKTFAIYLIPMLYGMVSPRYRTEQAIRYFWGWPLFFGLLALIQAVAF